VASPAAGGIDEVSFLEFRERAGLDRRRIPIEGTIETTYRCNLACVHCYVNQPAGSAEERERELSLERQKQLVDEIVAEGTLFVLFTGGEVLLRPDFPELYLYARSRGLLVTIFTNGTLVTDRIADLFAEHRPDKIEISLYGMTKETYDRVTRVPGSFEKCIAGIKRLVDRGIPVTLKTMALAWNHHEIEAMEAYAKSLGLVFRFDSSLNPRVDCGANRNSELQLDPERALALDLGSPERMEGFREFCERFTRADGDYGAEKIYTCGAGQSSFTVDPYGRLQSRFEQGWYELFPMLRARTWQKNEVCRKCSLIALCGSCPGAAEMETGDIEGVVPAFCELAHLRAWAVMGDGSGHRRDATCCFGTGALASRPDAEAKAALAGGCGSCGHADPAEAAAPPLIQLERRPRRA
jgi:radical SAM protein with 4Fe4S-binding SPASM domain